MSQGWDFYFVAIDGKVASMFVDLDAGESERGGLPFVARIEIALRERGPHGLSADSEFDVLADLDDRFAAIIGEWNGKYVGRCTWNGKRSFYAYFPVDPGEASLQSSLSVHPLYSPVVAISRDPEWRRYFEFLYPTPIAMRGISDRRLVAHLEESGDSLRTPRAVDHWCTFRDPEERTRFLARIQADGFAVRDTWDDAESASGRFAVQFTRVESVELDSISSTTRALFALAAERSGTYDGWETPLTKALDE